MKTSIGKARLGCLALPPWLMGLACVALLWPLSSLSLLGSSSAYAKGAQKSDGGGSAALGQAGCLELGLAGLYDFDPDDNTAAYADILLGYFPLNGIELGVTMFSGTNREGQRDTRGLFLEYDYVSGSRLVPFAGNAFKHAAPPTESDGKDARIFSVYMGAKIAAGASAALAISLTWEIATHAVLGPPGDRKRRNRDIDLSLRIFL